MDTITTAKLFHAGGKTWQERHSVDFIINGMSLYEMTGAKKYGLCGRFSPNLPDWSAYSAKNFLLEGDADDRLPDDHFMLFVCSECGDFGCGAITCKIYREGDSFVWQDFSYDNGYSDDTPDFESYSHIGPFFFSDSQYRQAITSASNTEQADAGNR